MKKSKTQIILLVLVTFVSLTSYVFMNHCALTKVHLNQMPETVVIQEKTEEKEAVLVLPDLKLIEETYHSVKAILSAL